MNLSAEHINLIKLFQKFEITEYKIYSKLARQERGKNRQILEEIAGDELAHYQKWGQYTKTEVKPQKIKIVFYLILSKIFGVTFCVKMLEKAEEKAEQSYSAILDVLPEVQPIIDEEIKHEQMLVNMIDEERLSYISSMILGLNDALVELTGALAGFTLALQNSKLIGLAGLITGIAASLSMAASEYLSEKSEVGRKDPVKAAIYTGIAYIVAVILLVLPFFLLSNFYLALLWTLTMAVIIIFTFSYFVSVVKDTSFKKFFWEMVVISMGVALISFFIGWLARKIFNVEV